MKKFLIFLNIITITLFSVFSFMPKTQAKLISGNQFLTYQWEHETFDFNGRQWDRGYYLNTTSTPIIKIGSDLYNMVDQKTARFASDNVFILLDGDFDYMLFMRNQNINTGEYSYNAFDYIGQGGFIRITGNGIEIYVKENKVNNRDFELVNSFTKSQLQNTSSLYTGKVILVRAPNNSGYDDGYNTGYINGNNDGIDTGYQQGKNVGYNEGYNTGYDKGLIDNPNNNITSLIASVFAGVGGIFGITLLPGITIGAIIAIPIIFGLIYFILGRKKE